MSAATRMLSGLCARPRLPGDKSITHRAYLHALLAHGACAVSGANEGEDCRRSLRAARALGVAVEEFPGGVRLTGAAGNLSPHGGPLDLGNSGTGFRLLLGILAGIAGEYELTGDASLRRRPMERVLEPLRGMGARATSADGRPPVRIRGGPLAGIDVTLPVPSAQIKSALLLAGTRARGVTRIRGIGASRDHTERLLAAQGVALDRDADAVAIRGPQAVRAVDVLVPGDPSAATFYLLAAAVVPGGEVELENVLLNPLRIRHFDLFRSMGLRVAVEAAVGDGEPRGTVRAGHGNLRGIAPAAEDVPAIIDELPALAVAAAFAEGRSVFRGAEELEVKESDRLRAVYEGLRSIGARATLLPDGWEIEGSGGEPLPGGEITSHGDHRIAMAFLVAGFRCRTGVRVTDADLIETSDPHFRSNVKEILESAP